MRKYIVATKDQRAAIMKVFGVTDRTVRNALGYDPQWGNTDTARRIREMARKQGATTYYAVTGDEVFFDSEGNMHQVFANGAEIFIDKNTGKREDHTLGNISLLLYYLQEGIDVRAYTDYGVFIRFAAQGDLYALRALRCPYSTLGQQE